MEGTLRRLLPNMFREKPRDAYNTQPDQRQLFGWYQYLKNQGSQLPRFSDAGYRVYSQVDEDGILIYIFSLIGFSNKLLVDAAFGAPQGANTTNLICNWGFSGLLIEGDKKKCDHARAFFSAHPDTLIMPPVTEHDWVTAENINAILDRNDIRGEIDLFSLDIDGNEYHVWKALTIVSPRVIIVEARTFWGSGRSVTIPYNPGFNRFDIHPDFYGASIAALVKLGHEKGYRLVACNRFGYNIFFVRNDIGKESLPEISIDECFSFTSPELKQKREAILKEVAGYKWIEV